MAKTGRPSTYDPAVATKMCEQLANGVPLREICRQEGMPPWQTVYSWMERDASLVEAIARARELGYDAIAEDCLRIADDTSNDYMETEHGPRLNAEHVQRSKLRIETRLKLLAKWSPKKYGERVQVAGDADNPIKLEAEVHADKLLQAILENAQMKRQASES
jgi:hypothetical protein